MKDYLQEVKNKIKKQNEQQKQNNVVVEGDLAKEKQQYENVAIENFDKRKSFS